MDQNTTSDKLSYTWRMLCGLFGKEILAATITVLVKDENGNITYTSHVFPQKDEK